MKFIGVIHKSFVIVNKIFLLTALSEKISNSIVNG